MNLWVEGGFAQMSVEGLAFMTKLVFKSVAEGMGWSEDMNLKSDMLIFNILF